MCGEAGEGQNDGNNNAAAAQNDIEAQAFGISTGIGNPNAEVDDFDDTSDFSVDPNAEPDDFDDTSNFGPDPNAEPDDFDNQQQDKSLSFFGRLDRDIQKGLGRESKGPPPGTLAGAMFNLAEEVGKGLDAGLGALGLEGEAPPQGPSTSDETGATDRGGDGAELPQPELARSVRAAGVAPRVQGASRRLKPAPAPAVPTGPTQADLDRERREQSEDRRRRASRRQGRESTINTSPLGVFEPLQLQQPRAVPGASKRFLGE